MDAVSSSTRSAINNAGGDMAISALKIAANAEKAVVAVVEQAVEAAQALPPPGQGQNVDKRA
jgi:hypothetical protein